VSGQNKLKQNKNQQDKQIQLAAVIRIETEAGILPLPIVVSRAS
jgi:hypothetical protein